MKASQNCSIILAKIRYSDNEGQTLRFLNSVMKCAVSREPELCKGTDKLCEEEKPWKVSSKRLVFWTDLEKVLNCPQAENSELYNVLKG